MASNAIGPSQLLILPTSIHQGHFRTSFELERVEEGKKRRGKSGCCKRAAARH